MGGLDHEPAPPDIHDNEETAARNARYGMVLFLAYLALYGSFVLINAFKPALMDRIVFAGVNLAIVYGFVLILAALALALVYGWICRTAAPSTTSGEGRS